MSEKIYNMVDLETIEKLADIVSAKDLGEITIADGEKTITVKGKKCPPPMGAPVSLRFRQQRRLLRQRPRQPRKPRQAKPSKHHWSAHFTLRRLRISRRLYRWAIP